MIDRVIMAHLVAGPFDWVNLGEEMGTQTVIKDTIVIGGSGLGIYTEFVIGGGWG